jgi:hypothetical protein
MGIKTKSTRYILLLFPSNKFRQNHFMRADMNLHAAFVSCTSCKENRNKQCNRLGYADFRIALWVKKNEFYDLLLRYVSLNILQNKMSLGMSNRFSKSKSRSSYYHSIILKYKPIQKHIKSRHSSVSMALGYGLDDRGSRFRFPAGAGNFSLHHRVQNGSGTHLASYRMSTRGSFLGGTAAGAWS